MAAGISSKNRVTSRKNCPKGSSRKLSAKAEKVCSCSLPDENPFREHCAQVRASSGRNAVLTDTGGGRSSEGAVLARSITMAGGAHRSFSPFRERVFLSAAESVEGPFHQVKGTPSSRKKETTWEIPFSRSSGMPRRSSGRLSKRLWRRRDTRP